VHRAASPGKLTFQGVTTLSDAHTAKKSLFAIVCLVLAALGLAACGSTSASTDPSAKGKGKGRGDAGPVPVVVTTVTQKDVPIEIQVVGNIEAYSNVSIRPQISGQLTSVHFNEGEFVKKGDLLFTIDPRPYEAQLAQLEANLLKDVALQGQAEANLARDKATEEYAKAQAVRYQQLFEAKLISKEQVGQFVANADALAQSVQADAASIQSAKAQAVADKAAISNAQVQLSYTTIKSPLDGRTGNLTIKMGNVVTANTTDMITINQVEPIYVTFSVPEARLGDIKHYNGNGGQLPVMSRPQDGDPTPEQGVLTFIDNTVDTTTGTIKLKGTFPNKAHRMWPGQFVNVVLRLTTQTHAVVVPNQAVQTGQDGQFIYVVKADRGVDVRKVTVGARIGEDLVIEKGVEAGETIVTEGQLRLSPASKVQFGEGRGRGGRSGGTDGGGKGGDSGGDKGPQRRPTGP
jgi:multidrug efflux system membrane fusion protein